MRVGVADDIQPMLRPALAVARRGQQPLNDSLVGIGALVCEKRSDFCGRRRQSNEIERYPPQPRQAIGFGRRTQPFRFETAEDKAVDVVPRPCVVRV